MNRTKLGISNCLEAALFYLLLFLSVFYSSGLFALPALVLGAFVLYKEDDLWLKASVLKGTLLVVLVFFICLCIGYVDDVLSFINFFLGIAETAPLTDGFGIAAWIKDIIFVIEKILFMLLSLFALNGKTLKLPVIDGIIGKHLR